VNARQDSEEKAEFMVILTKLNGKQIMINDDHIETVTENPDTVITLTNGHTYVVQESMEEILHKILAFNRVSKQRLRDSGRESQS